MKSGEDDDMKTKSFYGDGVRHNTWTYYNYTQETHRWTNQNVWQRSDWLWQVYYGMCVSEGTSDPATETWRGNQNFNMENSLNDTKYDVTE